MMKRSMLEIRILQLVAAAALLTACQTDSEGPGPVASLSAPAKPAEPPKPPEKPMTRSRAATECWMKTEKGSASTDLEKRADAVNKCIDEKMKSLVVVPTT
jgi:predicted small secreted protein